VTVNDTILFSNAKVATSRFDIGPLFWRDVQLELFGIKRGSHQETSGVLCFSKSYELPIVDSRNHELVKINNLKGPLILIKSLQKTVDSAQITIEVAASVRRT
jgi:hypothetical protein